MDCFNINAHYIFLVRKEHFEKYNVEEILNTISDDYEIILVDRLTEGAACTTLLAKNSINTDVPLIIVNSDQVILWNDSVNCDYFLDTDVDGAIFVFTASGPKWSYIKPDSNGRVTTVAEKQQISDLATIGVYYWKKGSDYVKYAEEMINSDTRVNGEFYVCPVYNNAIDDGKYIAFATVKEMWGIGTPEDLNEYLKHHDRNSTPSEL